MAGRKQSPRFRLPQGLRSLPGEHTLSPKTTNNEVVPQLTITPQGPSLQLWLTELSHGCNHQRQDDFFHGLRANSSHMESVCLAYLPLPGKVFKAFSASGLFKASIAQVMVTASPFQGTSNS